MGMTEEFEASLQVLRGFETDISVEVNEIKVLNIHTLLFFLHCMTLMFVMSNIFSAI